MFYYLHNLDTNILMMIQDNIRNPVLTPIFKFITILGNGGLIWILLIAIMICFKKTRMLGVLSLLSLILSFIINNMLLKNLVGRIRPFNMIPNLHALITQPTDFSFPSGHTASSFSVAGTIFLYGYRKYGIMALILATAIGFSRLYLGVHYPSDVLFGAVLGFGLSYFVSNCFVYLNFNERVKV